MTIDWWTLGLQTVNVVILFWILARFLFRPVGRILTERQAAAHAALDDAEAARAEAVAARNAAKAEREEIARKRAELLADAQAAAGREKQRLLEEARAAAETAREAGREELARMREAQQRELAGAAGSLATDIAGRLMARLPDGARVDGFIDGLAEAVAGLPEATRAGIGADGPVAVRTAREMTAEERDRLRQRLGQALGHPAAVEIETDQALIAGLELVAPHAIVRNSLRADLERIKRELTRHD